MFAPKTIVKYRLEILLGDMWRIWYESNDLITVQTTAQNLNDRFTWKIVMVITTVTENVVQESNYETS